MYKDHYKYLYTSSKAVTVMGNYPKEVTATAQGPGGKCPYFHLVEEQFSVLCCVIFCL